MQLQPYLFFDGRCDEAVAFYRETLGAEVQMLMRFGEHPDAGDPDAVPPDSAAKVMHMSMRIGDSVIMASDGRCVGQPDFRGFALSCTVPDVAAADRLFAALGEGGKVRMPLSETFFSPRFGMVADRFGVQWMIYVAPEDAAA